MTLEKFFVRAMGQCARALWLTIVGSVFQIDSQWIEDAFKVDGLPDSLVGAHGHGLVCVVVACQKTA